MIKKNIMGCLLALAFAFGGGADAASPLDVSYQDMVMVRTGTEDTLIFSDSPEYAAREGLLAEGTIKGKGRIYYYHVNELRSGARLVVYGQSDRTETVRITRAIRGVPGKDYITTGGTLAFQDVVGDEPKEKTVVLRPGVRTILFEENPNGIHLDDLVSGYVEVETRHPVRFGTAIFQDGDSLQEKLDQAKPILTDRHGMRGTFPLTVFMENKQIWDIETDGPKQIILGDGKKDLFYWGRDEMDGVMRENTGNFGMNYQITIHSKGTGRYDIYLNALGGVFQSVFQISQDGVPRIYRSWSLRKWFGHGTDQDYIWAGSWRAGRDAVIELTIPGAVYLPVRFLLVPREIEENKMEEQEPVS